MNLEVLENHPSTVNFPHPILFVHGATHGAWVWNEYWMPYFASKGFKGYAFSLRGHGHSPSHTTIANWRHYYRDLAEVIQTLPQPPILIGHAMGGYLVQRYLEHHHDIPLGVLVASVPPKGMIYSYRQSVMKYSNQFIQKPTEFATSNSELSKRFVFASRRLTNHLGYYHRQLKLDSWRAMLWDVSAHPPRPERVKTPMLVLGATYDWLIPRDSVEATAYAYHTEPMMFKIAHNMMLEPGWQAVADHIMTWLELQIEA